METLFFPLLLIAALAVPLVLGSRRQKRAMAEAQRLQDSLTEGDRVMTTSGLHGTVVNTADDATVDLEIAPGVRTTWARAAIRERITDDPVEPAADDRAGGQDADAADVAPPTAEAARSDKS